MIVTRGGCIEENGVVVREKYTASRARTRRRGAQLLAVFVSQARAGSFRDRQGSFRDGAGP